MKKPFSKILIWQWGRKGAGPKIAIEIFKTFKQHHDYKAFLSLSDAAEILSSQFIIECDLPVKTYHSMIGFICRWLQAPWIMLLLYRKLKKMKIDLAICAMPGPLDLIMAWTLKLLNIPFVVIVHDAIVHPGDGYLFQNFLQQKLIQHACFVVTFSNYVTQQLIHQKKISVKKIITAWHPPFDYGFSTAIQPHNHKAVRLLHFGRLLPYKGLDLLESALELVHSEKEYELRIVGSGPHSAVLEKLAQRSNVYIENRWVAEDEIASLIEWADVILLPYREASQSGVAAIALAIGKRVIATRVGGLVEQFEKEKQAILCAPNPTDIAKSIEASIALDPPQPIYRDCAAEWRTMIDYFMEEIDSKTTR